MSSSVDDIELRAAATRGSMRLGAIGHLVADAGREREGAPVGELRFQLALETQQEMTLAAPVVGDVARRVLEHAHAHRAELARAPARLAAGTRVRRDLDATPVDESERQLVDLHLSS